MMEKIPIYFEKYANFDRIGEPCNTALPLPERALNDAGSVVIRNEEGKAFPTQAVPTAFWPGGSIKWLYIDFICSLPKNKDITYYICFDGEEASGEEISYKAEKGGLTIEAGGETFSFEKELNFYLNGRQAVVSGQWRKVRSGAVTSVFKAAGSHGGFMDFEITVQAYKNCPWVKVDYKLINRENEEYVPLESLSYIAANSGEDRFTIGTSNYLTKFTEGESIKQKIDAEYLLYDANEHFAETFYGTFFGDSSAEGRGTAVTLYQAYQNFPAEIGIDKKGMNVKILAAEEEPLKFFRGMAKTSTLFIHKHKGISKEDVNLRSLMFQMPDKCVLPSEIYEKSGCFPEIFLKRDERIQEVETSLMQKFDSRGRAYGFIHWGDNIDAHYTAQGRGQGRAVWVNNEYDFGHAAFVFYAKTGLRRAIDGMLVSVMHQMDVDIVHCSDDPYRLDGQVTHSADHVSGKVEISHEWAEGLLDYYHLTADREAYDTAVRMGENIIRNLSKPRYNKKGGVNARETGWALRSLCALYAETNDPKWLAPCDDIVEHFTAWKEEYGRWLAPYTDHTVIRVPFMISIAIISLMRYYSISGSENIKDMIISAAEDLTENAYLDSGYFYYKELSSLKRNAGNTTLLEAMVIAYKLTGDKTYLKYGVKTFEAAVEGKGVVLSAGKRAEKDAVVISGNSSKGVGQSFIPLMTYYTACVKAGVLPKNRDKL
ncbi:MAG: glycoside hydrolase family 127 protein [Clostridiales bacterium]|nr:glycoside hydrolase family 127 protein [Clostridiales bacterium]